MCCPDESTFFQPVLQRGSAEAAPGNEDNGKKLAEYNTWHSRLFTADARQLQNQNPPKLTYVCHWIYVYVRVSVDMCMYVCTF